MDTKSLNVEVPHGLYVQAVIPKETDNDLATVLFKCVLGALTAIEHIKDDESRRAFLVRYAASIVNETNSLAHSSQLSNEFNTDSSAEKIVDEFLKSLHKRS